MMRYTLKQYNRDVPVVGAGKHIAEWTIEATTVDEAISIAHHLLNEFRPPEGFAILWDEMGKTVWETGVLENPSPEAPRRRDR